MPFLTLTDVRPFMPSGYDEAYIQLLLSALESHLRSKGLIFTASLGILKLQANEGFYQHVFSTPYIRNITAIKIRNYQSDSSNVLIEGADYLLSKMISQPDYIYQINLTHSSIRWPQYLEVAAMLNFSAVSASLKLAIVSLAKQASQMYQGGGREIVSTSDGDTSYTFTKASDALRSMNFSQIPELQAVLIDYITP